MPYKNLGKAQLFLRNQVICLKIWKFWWAPTFLWFNIFYWNFAHVFYLPLSKKGCVGLFLFYLDLELFAKIKRPGFYTLIFYTFINNSRSKQNIKNPTHPFVDINKEKRCAKFQQKILKSVVVGACQSFQFFRQKTCFEIIEICFNLGVRLCMIWLVLLNYQKISP